MSSINPIFRESKTDAPELKNPTEYRIVDITKKCYVVSNPIFREAGLELIPEEFSSGIRRGSSPD